MKRFAVLIAIAACGLGVEAASPAPVLTLDQAVALALQHNERLLAATADLEAAEAGLDAARAARRPQADLTGTVTRTTNPTLVFSHKLGQESFAAEDFAVDRLNRPDALTNVQAGVAVSVPLWTGGRIKNGIAVAELGRDAGAAGRERTRQEVIYEALDAYSAAVLATASAAVAREAVATAEAHVKLVQSLREGGLVVESDLLQARVRLSELEEQRIRAEAAVETGYAAVNLVLGRDLGTPFALPDVLTERAAAELSLVSLIEEALDGRPDLDAARIAAEAAARGVALQRSTRRPELGLTGMVEANSDRITDADGTNWTVLAGARWKLFDGGAAKARVRQADRQRRSAELRRSQQARFVELEVRRAFHERRAAFERREQARRAVELAREGLRIVEDRYGEGLSTVVELLDAETALTHARSRETAAARDVVLTGAALDLAVGRL